MKLGRLLAVAGLGYGAYRWLNRRPRTMAKVKSALRDVGDAARRGDLAGARQALSGLGEAIGDDRRLRQVVDRVQATISDVGSQVRQTLTPTGDTAPAIDAATAGAAVPICATLVAAGHLASRRGTTQAIRTLGDRLAEQFSRIGAQIQALGENPAMAPDEPGRQLLAALEDLAGNLFDAAFLDETMNAVIRLLDTLPAMAAGLGTQLRDLQADIARLGERTVHQRAAALPGPGTSVPVEGDRESA